MLEGGEEEEGGITFNIASVSGRLVKLPVTTKRRYLFSGALRLRLENAGSLQGCDDRLAPVFRHLSSAGFW